MDVLLCRMLAVGVVDNNTGAADAQAASAAPFRL
jgi:hypothetical protein